MSSPRPLRLAVPSLLAASGLGLAMLTARHADAQSVAPPATQPVAQRAGRTITVSGADSVRIEADAVRFEIRPDVSDEKNDAASTAQARADAEANVRKALGDAKLDATGVTTMPADPRFQRTLRLQTPWIPLEELPKWEAGLSTARFDQTRRADSMGSASLEWRVPASDVTAVRDASLRRAALDAKRRADAIANALGARVGPPVTVAVKSETPLQRATDDEGKPGDVYGVELDVVFELIAH